MDPQTILDQLGKMVEDANIRERRLSQLALRQSDQDEGAQQDAEQYRAAAEKWEAVTAVLDDAWDEIRQIVDGER
jgi:hypothetical protein